MRNNRIPAILGCLIGLVIGAFLSARLGLGNMARTLLCIAVAAACGWLADYIYKSSRPQPAPPGAGPGNRIAAYCPRCGAPIDQSGLCPNCGRTTG